MVRPERFELPTFWFVARRRENQAVCFQVLTASLRRFNCSPIVPQVPAIALNIPVALRPHPSPTNAPSGLEMRKTSILGNV